MKEFNNGYLTMFQELLSRKKPFHDAHNVQCILFQILCGPPGRPDDECTCSRMTEAWWKLCNLCWKRDPSSRPEISKLVVMIEQLD